MSSKLVELLCQVKGANLAQKLCIFLNDHDVNCLGDDDDLLELLLDWECKTTAQLANQLNMMMVEKFKAYLELNLVDIENRNLITPMLEYKENYNPDNPELSSFSVWFNGAYYQDWENNNLIHLCDTIVLYNKMLSFKVFPQFLYALYTDKELIDRVCAIDNTAVKVPFNLKKTEALLINVAYNEHFERVLDEIREVKQQWAMQIQQSKPTFLMLVDKGDGDVPYR